MPITWKNVTNTGAANAAVGARLFEQSREAMNDGFTGLRDLLRQNQATDLANWDQVKENNTNTALDNLRKYATPEAYAAAQAAGVLAPDAALGAQVDRRAVAEAADNRLGILQDAALKTNEYANSQRDQKDLPILSKYESQLLSLDPSSAIDNQTGIAILEQAKGEGVSEVGLSKLAAMFRTTSMENQEFKSGQEATAAQIAASQASTGRTNYLMSRSQLEDKRADDLFNGTKIGNELAFTSAETLANAYKTDATLPSEEVEKAKENIKIQLSSKGYGSDIIEGAVNAFTNKLNTARELVPQVQAKLDAKLKPLEASYTSRAEQLKTRFDNELKNNPLVKEDVVDPEAKMAELVTTVDKDSAWGSDERGPIMTFGTSTLANGLNVDGAHYDVTPGMMQEALRRVQESNDLRYIADEEGELKLELENMIKDPGFEARKRAADNLRQTYIEDTTKLDSLHASKIYDETQKFRESLYKK